MWYSVFPVEFSHLRCAAVAKLGSNSSITTSTVCVAIAALISGGRDANLDCRVEMFVVQMCLGQQLTHN